jgi:hypothetical protein
MLAGGHGLSASPVWQGGRTVRLRGTVRGFNADARDALLMQLAAVMVPRASADSALESLTGDRYGLSVTADAQLVSFSTSLEGGTWQGGVPAWFAEFRCPDPRFYSGWVSESAALVAPSAGLTLPQTLPFTLTANPLGGQVSVYNSGNDPEGSPLRVTLTGGQSGTVGVEVSKPSGVVERCTWSLTLASDRGDGSPNTLVIDTERGGAFLDGYAYRATTPGGRVSALRLEPGVNVVRALGTAGAGSPSILAAVRPRSW